MGNTTLFNYREDFDLLLLLLDITGAPVGYPDFSWRCEITTADSPRTPYVATAANTHDDRGRIHITARAHGLGPGRLRLQFSATVLAPHYPGGMRDISVAVPLDVTLTDITTGTPSLPPTIVVQLPVALTAQPGAPDGSDEPDLQAIAAGCYLSVDRNEGASRLIAHGVQPLLDAGLTPVLFRCLRRRNKNTEGARVVTHRWTRFTMLPDAVAIDADGVLSFRTDLLPGEDGTHQETAEYTTEASALCLRADDAVVYGKPLMRLDGEGSDDEPRMLRLPYMLAFLDLSGEEQPARRWTIADSPVRLPFFVRYTPMWHYATTDLAAESKSVEHVFSFTLR